MYDLKDEAIRPIQLLLIIGQKLEAPNLFNVIDCGFLRIFVL